MKIKNILKCIAYATAFTAVYNKTVAVLATAFKCLKTDEGSYYDWEYGKVFYTKTGSGSPVVLLHDLTSASSGYEWCKIVKELSKEHTVYVPDLLGCGRSDKPGISYSNFLYVKFLTSFLREIVGESCTIVATGNSSSFAILGSAFSSDLVNDLICINPVNPNGLDQAKNFADGVKNTVLSVPIFGTTLYNHYQSQGRIADLFKNKYLFNETDDLKELISAYHESAHLKLRFARNFYASESLNYCVLPVKHILSDLKFNLKLVFGAEEESVEEIAELYKELNSNISIEYIPETKHLPHLENSEMITQIIA